MISELSSTLTLDYQPPAMLTGHGPTLAFDPDRDLSQPMRPHSIRSNAAAHDDSAFCDFSPSISSESLSTRTDYWDAPIDLRSRLAAELADSQKQARETHRAYWHRIEALRSDAALDGFEVNKASERDFWSFIESGTFTLKAEVVLVDNGNLRAVWDGEGGWHLGLQFLGGRLLQYVIFRRRRGSSYISRVAGRDTFDGIKRQVQTFELETFLQI